MAKARAKPASKTLEQRLWAAADALRGNQEPSEYKHVVLGLVFLKYISDRFEERRKTIGTALSDPESSDYIPIEKRRVQLIEDRDEYASHNVFWVPSEARWQHIQDRAKLPSIGQDIDAAMDLIENENPSIRGVLPRNYAREGLDKGRLGKLVDLIGSIGFTETDDHGSDDVLGRVYEYFLGPVRGQGDRPGRQTHTHRPTDRRRIRCHSADHLSSPRQDDRLSDTAHRTGAGFGDRR